MSKVIRISPETAKALKELAAKHGLTDDATWNDRVRLALGIDATYKARAAKPILEAK